MDAGLDVLELGNRERRVLASESRLALANVDQRALIAIDEWTEEHAADDGEDGRVGADPKREREDHRDRETFGARERTERESEVAREHVDFLAHVHFNKHAPCPEVTHCASVCYAKRPRESRSVP